MRFGYSSLQLTYLIAQLCAVCVMTRLARGWRVTGAALALYALLRIAYDWGCVQAGLSPQTTLALRFVVLWPFFALLVIFLSRDHIGRRLFLALDYGAYSAALMPVCQAFELWKPTVCPCAGAVCAMVTAVVAHAVFVFVLLPFVPQGLRTLKDWLMCASVALAILFGLYATGIWPLNLATGDWRTVVVFVVIFLLAWVVFPILCFGLRLRHHQLGFERSVAFLMGEVRMRREVIDAARRLRHDQRHHRIQLSEYLLRGQVDRALSYLEQLDGVAQETPTDKLIWCENDTINAILSGYSRKADEKGVRLKVEVNVEKSVAIPDVEIVAVISNLLDNAIRATPRGGEVTVAIRQREWTFGLTVTNPVPADFALSAEGLPCVEPGIGMESVRRVIARRNGAYTYKIEDGETEERRDGRILACQAMMRVQP